ncbi:MAG: hypothetical protein KGK30_10190, partial [Elusimicrobia bacterium]|nr:hypothetical protein [Elusimicrobiota bacterium]
MPRDLAPKSGHMTEDTNFRAGSTAATSSRAAEAARSLFGGVTSAVDRDLKTLVGSGQVRRLGYGLYCRARKAPSGDALSHERELLRAFLKTDDFLLASYDDF